MNKKMNLLLAFFSLAFMSCSDISSNSSDFVVATTNTDLAIYSAPGDFDLETYLVLNPDVKYNQIIMDLKNNSFYNPERLDSMVTTKNDAATVAAAKASFEADNLAFLKTDPSFTKRIFKMAGYSESSWLHVDSLNSEQKKMILRFNKQQNGAPSFQEDTTYLFTFKYDNELLENHYTMFGLLNGRPYRYCNGASELVLPKSQVVPDTLGKRPFILDYSANLFCYDSTTSTIYAIK